MTTNQQIDERVLNGYIAQAMEKQAPPGFSGWAGGSWTGAASTTPLQT